MLKSLQLHVTKILLTTAFLLLGVISWGQVTIASQDFETSPATPTITFSAGSTGSSNNYSTGTNPSNARPANAPLYVSGTRGWNVINTTATLTFSNVSLTGYTNAYVEFRLAGMSINNSNGIDTSDYILVSISLDGGATYSKELNITSSGSNYYWPFSNTGSVAITYDGNDSATTHSSANNGSGTTTARVNLPVSATQVRVKLEIRNNDGNERWVIDDLLVKGSISAPTVTTGAASSITTTGATLNGTINANGTSTTPSFQYGLTTSYGSNTTATPSPVTGSSSTAISKAVTGLSVNTQYHFRAVGTQSTATNGSDATFWTLAAQPNAPEASNVDIATANLVIGADGNPSTTQYAIYDLLSELYVQTDGTLGASAVWRTASQWGTINLNGLTPETEYAFFVKARNGANTETEFSLDGAQITTLANTSPTITADPLTAFGAVCINTTTTENSFGLYGQNLTTDGIVIGPLTGYTFSATANGTYATTLTYYADGGGELLEEVFVRFTPTDVTSYNADIPVTGGGTSVTTYIAASGSGINTAPSITTAAATLVTEFTATLGGTVTVEGCTSVTATGVVYATTTTPVIGGMGVTQLATALPETAPFTVDATGLTPSTLYYVRSYAINDGGTTYGSQVTFTTDAYVLDAAVAEEETSTTTSSFYANWQSVSGATGYRLDVSTDINFETTTPGSTTTEGFANVPNGTSTSSYQDRTWTGDDGVTTWTAFNSRSDQTIIDGSETIGLRNASGSYLISGTINGGVTNIQFDVQQVFSGSGGQLTIKVLTGAGFTTESFVDTMSYSATLAAYDSGVISGITGDYKIRIDNNGAARPVIDNLAYTSADISVSSYVSGYENLSVGNVTTYDVTGLEQGTTYYYRVRAENTDYSVTSSNSNVINAVTGAINVWNGTEWSAGYVPTEIDDAIITGAYNTGDEGTFTAATLTINTGGSIVIASGDNITVIGEVTNNEEASAFLIESNANLIQVNDVANTGDIQVQKDSSPLYRLDYTLWSSPVLNQNLLAYSPQTLTNRFYDYDESTDLYTSIAPGSNNFEAGRGYLIRMPNTHVAYVDDSTPGEAWTGTFEGEPINGLVTVPMEAALNGYNLVGNPYPSPIYISDFYTVNAGTIKPGSALYFWRKRNNPDASTYCTLTSAAYTANSAAGGNTGSWFNGTDSSNWVINSGQGFFVQATGGSLVFNNDMRAEVNNNQFFRTTPGNTQQSSRLWLNITAENKFSQTAIVYNPNMTLGIDYGWDGKAFVADGPVTIYTLAQEESLAIQARPEFDSTDRVNLGFYVETPGNYTISLDHVDGLFEEGQDIYLIDYVTEQLIDLNEGSYEFTTESGIINDRFVVVYNEAYLGTETPVLNANEVVVYQTNGDININAGTLDITAVTVHDMRGRALYTNNDVNASQLLISNLESAQQVLIVNITTNKGTVSKKVVY